jgi:hypothetical protein
MKRWWTRILRRRRALQVIYLAPMSKAKLLQAFSVEADNRLLLAVLAVLRGLHELAAENAEVDEQADSLTLKYAARMAAFREAEERILYWVDKAKRGGESEKRKADDTQIG